MTKKFMSAYFKSGYQNCCDEDGYCAENDDGYWSGSYLAGTPLAVRPRTLAAMGDNEPGDSDDDPGM